MGDSHCFFEVVTSDLLCVDRERPQFRFPVSTPIREYDTLCCFVTFLSLSCLEFTLSFCIHPPLQAVRDVHHSATSEFPWSTEKEECAQLGRTILHT
jgi:hypothetical protein